MGLKYILDRFGAKMGLDPANPGQRSVMLGFVNEAALELYTKVDVAGSLMEQLFKVNGDQTIALPPYVGHIRGMRESDTFIAWHLNQMRPRYNQYNWMDTWRNWRDKGISPLQTSIRNQAPITVTVGSVETPPIVVTIVGSTLTATSISESVTMDSLSKTTSTSFLDVYSVKKDRVCNNDAILTDADGIQISMVPNNMLEAMFRIIDVSLFPFQNNNSGVTDHYLEVLYKKALPWMENDSDEYPAKNCDNILVNKAMQLWCEQQGKVEEAIAYDSKATRSLAERQEDENRASEDMVALVQNGHDSLSVRIRPHRRVYRGWWRGPYGM